MTIQSAFSMLILQLDVVFLNFTELIPLVLIRTILMTNYKTGHSDKMKTVKQASFNSNAIGQNAVQHTHTG